MPRRSTLSFDNAPQATITDFARRAAVKEAERALHPVKAAWIPIADIDETPDTLNSRRAYDEQSINELAESIKENGVLQPVCVRPAAGGRYTLVFGMRRLKASIRAGLEEIPATIQIADDDRAFLLNTLENLHRVGLSGAERVAAIEKLSATSLGTREISRRTGFSQTTISRWMRLDRNPTIRQALEEDRLDIGRAMVLATAPQDYIERELDNAASMPQPDLWQAVRKARRGHRGTAPRSHAALQDALRLLETTADRGGELTDEDMDVLDDITKVIRRLRRIR